jgi:hypothetical protein
MHWFAPERSGRGRCWALARTCPPGVDLMTPVSDALTSQVDVLIAIGWIDARQQTATGVDQPGVDS